MRSADGAVASRLLGCACTRMRQLLLIEKKSPSLGAAAFRFRSYHSQGMPSPDFSREALYLDDTRGEQKTRIKPTDEVL